MRRILSSIVFTVASLCPWLAHAQPPPPSSCSTTSQNIWVRDQLNTYYYWYQFLPGNVSPTSFNSPEAFLDAVRYRPIDNTYSYITSAAANDAFYDDSQFVGYGLSTQTTSEMRVLQVYDGSPALEAGLSRGDRITRINGQDVEALIANGTIGSAFGAAAIGVASDVTFVTPTGEQRSARMVKRLVTIPTVSLTQVVEVDGRKVGYLFFRNFVRPSMQALTDAFAALKAAGATELILDLRYNGGGLVDVAVHLGSLIGGARTSGQVMINYVHNDKIAPLLNKTVRFNQTPAEALNLQRLFVITTRSSASASEQIINALRPYIPVTVVGDTTYGKPVGQYGLNFCDKVLVPVAFSLKNVNNEGDFFDGIPANCAAADDINHQLGDPAEASYAEALTVIRTGACSARTEAESRAQRALRNAAPRLTGWAALLNVQ